MPKPAPAQIIQQPKPQSQPPAATAQMKAPINQANPTSMPTAKVGGMMVPSVAPGPAVRPNQPPPPPSHMKPN
jgi:hypothetical protein